MEDVVIVGAGPTGLWLAAELRLGGASVTVLEARHERDPNSKALTIHPRTVEIFDCRGVVEPFLAEALRIPTGHFGGLPDRMDFSALDTPYPFTLALLQARAEELLEARAEALGATIRRGCEVVGLTGAVVELADGSAVATRYVVGCDGVRSTVRTAAGIDFPGSDATTWGWLGDVVLDTPPQQDSSGRTDISREHQAPQPRGRLRHARPCWQQPTPPGTTSSKRRSTSSTGGRATRRAGVAPRC